MKGNIFLGNPLFADDLHKLNTIEIGLEENFTYWLLNASNFQ